MILIITRDCESTRKHSLAGAGAELAVGRQTVNCHLRIILGMLVVVSVTVIMAGAIIVVLGMRLGQILYVCVVVWCVEVVIDIIAAIVATFIVAPATTSTATAASIALAAAMAVVRIVLVVQVHTDVQAEVNASSFHTADIHALTISGGVRTVHYRLLVMLAVYIYIYI
jgi:hypothetical protein